MRHPTQLHAGNVPWPQVRVLVYSQDESFCFLVRQTFRKLAVRAVLVATTPAQADTMLAQAPDIALVDVHGKPGAALSFLQALRDADAALPVLLAAKAVERGHLAPLQALGVAGVVPKPISGHELIHRVGDSLTPRPRPKAVAEAEAAAAPPVRIATGTYGADDGPTPAPTPVGGRYADDDESAPAAASASGGHYGEEAPAPTDPADWLAELAASGHRPRTGADTGRLDITAIVATHADWLASRGAQGKRADCGKMDLAGVDLGGAVLSNAGFRAADLSDARLAQARLDGADFRHAVLGAADLAAATLAVAQLRHCDLRLANLHGANLRGADLSGARLAGAKLAGADFQGAILVGCDLGDSDLAQVEGLVQAQVDKAICDGKTRLPAGLIRPAADAER